MGLSFLTSSEQTIDVITTVDPAVEASPDQVAVYLETGDQSKLNIVGNDATRFTLKALSPVEREEAECRAGALTRSELGRLLWSEAPDDAQEKARWHHALTSEDREAMSDYQQYLNRVYIEMIRSSLVSIDGEQGNVEMIQQIRPESHRVQVISELVLHIQRISLLGIEGK